jgi:hypothetical protein
MRQFTMKTILSIFILLWIAGSVLLGAVIYGTPTTSSPTGSSNALCDVPLPLDRESNDCGNDCHDDILDASTIFLPVHHSYDAAFIDSDCSPLIRPTMSPLRPPITI